MATRNDGNQEKKKKGGAFLKVCIVLAVLSALILGGWIFTSSIVFLRNAIMVAAVGSVGVALAKPVVNKINNAISNSKSKKRVRNRDRNRTRDNLQTLVDIPTQKQSEREEIVQWNPITKSKTSSQNKSNR